MDIFNNIAKFAKKNDSTILVCMGLGGMGGAIYFAITATNKACKKLKGKEKYSIKEKIKEVWKYYIPSATLFGSSTMCIIKANNITIRKNAALATAYNLIKTEYNSYKDHAIEKIGENKVKKIQEDIIKDKVQNDSSCREIVVTDTNSTLCYDSIFGRYFVSNVDKIKRAVAELNESLMKEDYVSLNDFYDLIGLRPTKAGYDLGWNSSDGHVDINFDSYLSEDNRPCLAIWYTVSPRPGYDKLY